MNIRLITIIIFVVIITGGLVIFFMNGQNTKELAERISPTREANLTPGGTSMPQNMTEVKSSDDRVTFMYPNSWQLTDSTGTKPAGKFGKILESWSITGDTDGASATQNAAVVTVEIEAGGSNLAIDDLVDCGMKTVSCDKIGIDNEQFIKSDAMLNSGVRLITVATFYDSNILRATAQVFPGSDQEKLTQEAESILMSFHFTN